MSYNEFVDVCCMKSITQDKIQYIGANFTFVDLVLDHVRIVLLSSFQCHIPFPIHEPSLHLFY